MFARSVILNHDIRNTHIRRLLSLQHTVLRIDRNRRDAKVIIPLHSLDACLTSTILPHGEA